MVQVNLPCCTLLKAKQMPVTQNKLRRLMKSKHPYVEHNLDAVVNIIRHSIQNAAAFEVVAQQLKEGLAITVSNIFNNCHFGMIEYEFMFAVCLHFHVLFSINN